MRILLMLSVVFLHGSFSSFILAAQQKHVITSREKTDGFGAQVQMAIVVAVYCLLNNTEFCYRPFSKMEHNYDKDPDFIAKKEWLLNFKDNFLTIDQARKKGYRIIPTDSIRYFDSNVDKVGPALEILKKIFRANKKDIGSYFNNGRFNIAIHIRRPNPHDSRVYGTDVPDQIYLEVIKKLRIQYADKNPLFHIYSQGNIDSFKMYSTADVILHLDEPLEETYLGMVFADVLVTGRSSLSYTAGYLSDGIIYYTSYRHAPLPHWIMIEKLLINT